MTSKLTFDILLSEAAGAVLKAVGNKPVFYVNDVRIITKNCDCFSNPGALIAKDVGIVLGDDIVAVEMASTDAVINHDPYLHIKEAEKLGLGNGDYDLVPL
jgi:uncharacterized Fe-S center protein